MTPPAPGVPHSRVARLLRRFGFGRADPAPALPRLLLISHRGERCGVQQFGRRLFECLQAGGVGAWRYAECSDAGEAMAAIAAAAPEAVLLNYHPNTLAWATGLRRRGATAPLFAVYHEAHLFGAHLLGTESFDFHLCPDPTLVPPHPSVLPVPRFIPQPRPPATSPPDTFTIGSFGFPTGGKGFDRLCHQVNAEFETARIRINLAPHDNPDVAPLAASIVAACRAEVTKPGISLEITTDFMDEAALIGFLGENTINAFFYDDMVGRGLSSCIDYALACGRPLAVSGSSMFRHVHTINPTILAGERSLRDIAASGTAPLRAHVGRYAPAAAGAAWSRAILDGLGRHRAAATKPAFNGMIPEGEAAFALDAATRLLAGTTEARVLVVGHPDCQVAAALRQHGWRLDTIAAGKNGSGIAAAIRQGAAIPGSYDLLLCPGVLDGVACTEAVVRMLADLLGPGGCAAVTVTLAEGGLTAADLHHRLMQVLPDCGLVDPASWPEPWPESWPKSGGASGSGRVVGWVFRKFDLATQRHAWPALARVRSDTPSLLLTLFELEAYGTLYDDIYSQLGTKTNVGDLNVYQANGVETGFLAFGPYIPLPAGSYDGTFALLLGSCEVPPDTVVATIDTALDREPQAPLRDVLRSDLEMGGISFVTCRITLERDVDAVEIRVLLKAAVPLAIVCAVAIRRVEAAARTAPLPAGLRAGAGP